MNNFPEDPFGGITDMLLDNIKQAHKESRNNSKRFYKHILSIACNKCEICEWTPPYKTMLNIHHIIPINEYKAIMIKDYWRVDKTARLAWKQEINNLVALCPNCHSLIHKLYTIKDKNEKSNFYRYMAETMPIKSIEMLMVIGNKFLRSQWHQIFNNRKKD